MTSILVVDDESAIVDLFELMMQVAGHKHVSAARSGDEAVQSFRESESPPDLVLMDERMAGKSGLEATREILASWPATRILIVSADVTVRRRWEAAGAWGFVEKPVAQDELQRAVEATLRGAPVNVSPAWHRP